jgi:hypothetical protein
MFSGGMQGGIIICTLSIDRIDSAARTLYTTAEAPARARPDSVRIRELDGFNELERKKGQRRG